MCEFGKNQIRGGKRAVRKKQSEHTEKAARVIQHSVTVGAHIDGISPQDVSVVQYGLAVVIGEGAIFSFPSLHTRYSIGLVIRVRGGRLL